MKPTLQYFGSVDNGKLTLPRRDAMKSDLRVFNGCDVQLTIKVRKGRRSTPQNSYYWGVVLPAVTLGFIDIGHPLQVGNQDHVKMVHGLMKDKFLFNGIEVTDREGEVMTLPPSTKTLDKGEMMEYMDRVIDWATINLGVYIPAPNEQAELQY
jgi:hypothetical protein